MSWLLPVMALDVVDEAVVNAKVVRALAVYSSTMTERMSFHQVLEEFRNREGQMSKIWYSITVDSSTL